MLVMKFGGTSVGSAESIRQVVRIIEGRKEQRPVVVVSAFSGTTDMLIEAAGKGKSEDEVREKHAGIMKELGVPESVIKEDLEELRQVLEKASASKEPELSALAASFGERMSSKIIAAFACREGLKAVACNSYDLGLLTDSDYMEAEVLPESYERIAQKFRFPEDEIPVITGFIAKDGKGSVTLLGRGGSDYSASIFGIAAGAKEIQIWTDVNGMLTADPRLVPEARTIREIRFSEAAELAYFGAKVLHPKTIQPAVRKNIPVRIMNTFRPEDPGTKIMKEARSEGAVTALTYKKRIKVINISSLRMLFVYGFMEKVFRLFSKHRISVDSIATTEVSVSVTIDGKYETDPLVRDLEKLAKVEVSEDVAGISVVGRAIKHTPGIAGNHLRSPRKSLNQRRDDLSGIFGYKHKLRGQGKRP